jgi:hypothetical protein
VTEPVPTKPLEVCKYHGRTYVWTLFANGWGRGDASRYTLAAITELDGPLVPMDYLGDYEDFVAEVSRLTSALSTAERDVRNLTVMFNDAVRWRNAAQAELERTREVVVRGCQMSCCSGPTGGEVRFTDLSITGIDPPRTDKEVQ